MRTLFSLVILIILSSTLAGQTMWSSKRKVNIVNTLSQGKIVNDAKAVSKKNGDNGRLFLKFSFGSDFFADNKGICEKLVGNVASFLAGFICAFDSASYTLYINFFENDNRTQSTRYRSDYSGVIRFRQEIERSKLEASFLKILPFKSSSAFYANGYYCLILGEESKGVSEIHDENYYGIIAAVIHYYLTNGRLDVKIFYSGPTKTEVYTFTKDSDYEKALRHIPECRKIIYSKKTEIKIRKLN